MLVDRSFASFSINADKKTTKTTYSYLISQYLLSLIFVTKYV